MPSQVTILIAVVAVMFSVIGGLSLLAHYYTLSGIKSKTVGDGQHGTARFATEGEIKKTYTHVPYEPEKWRRGQNLPALQGLVVGCKQKAGATIALIDDGDIHCLMIGAAGVGKTANFLYPNIEYACASGMSFLCTDTKGDLFRNYAGIAKDYYGFKISVLDLRNPTRSDGDNNLQLAKELGYRTIFWSLAYVDWKQEEQPTREEAMSKLLKRVHPGAIVLLHNTSRTNGEILDEVLTKWEEMGYHFASLEELVSSGSREARSFFLTDNQENPVKSAAPTHAAGSQKQARGKLTSFMAISAVIMRANSSTTPPIIGRKL